jgi:hypothetical protein
MAPAPKKIGRAHCTIFDLQTLQEATEHFAEKNKLGAGGFGTVSKVSFSSKIFHEKIVDFSSHRIFDTCIEY